MRRALLFCSLVLLSVAPRAFAQGILPSSVAGWNSTAAAAAAPGTGNLYQLAGANSAALQEYGVQAADSRTYTHGADSFTATAYSFVDTSGSYGAYSLLRTPDMAPAKFTQHSSRAPGRVLALTGNLVIQITGRDLRRDDAPIDLLVAQAGAHATWGAYPALPQRMPAEHMVPRSDHYILGPVALAQFMPIATGDWLGFSKGAEAELAHYRLDGSDATLLVADYPTPQIAADQMEKLKAQFRAATPGDSDGAAKTQSPSSNAAPQIYVQRDGLLLAVLSGAPSGPAADSLLKQVQASLVLTWNVPIAKANQPSMATIVVGTIIGSGEVCAFTLLGGVVFAGIRLLIKRFLPGRVFDRAQDFEILELGLSSRAIKSNDLYQMRGPS